MLVRKVVGSKVRRFDSLNEEHSDFFRLSPSHLRKNRIFRKKKKNVLVQDKEPRKSSYVTVKKKKKKKTKTKAILEFFYFQYKRFLEKNLKQ